MPGRGQSWKPGGLNDGVVRIEDFHPEVNIEGFTTVFKPADQTINSNSTFFDDVDLRFTPVASGIYAIFGFIMFKSNSTANFKYRFAVPGAPEGGFDQLDFSGGTATQIAPFSSPITLTVPDTTPHVFNINATILLESDIGATPVFAFRWAQSVSDAGDTTLLKGSWLSFKKIN